MPKKNRFDYFDAFRSQADAARRESQALVAVFEDFRPNDEQWALGVLESMHGIENEGDVLVHGIMDQLAVEFMPPIDREDVTELAMALDDVTDQIEEVAQHLYMYNITELHPCAVRVARVINEAAEALCEATDAFREFKKPKKLSGLLVAVHDRESEGDDLYIEAKRDLFVNHADASAAYLLAWNGMFSHMEQCCDACERVASVMQKISLKNS
jgi:uncharacterized protein Yka (UPF0111/DUF47 family)